ncbi:hypothetical protein DERF_004551 [Dermatophagoides farinae]|uniref:Uncharacterized protein n=1 Tax=Dermatophagoides farinae TaxID=6954 RepID=A0A922I1P1_DERFA|nr:hypothetical protein HUG17_0622 [Dermatophagoides farinae]KAH9520867.1 hypothetical protein DERF_004551 [Dermatophagoides farinae]
MVPKQRLNGNVMMQVAGNTQDDDNNDCNGGGGQFRVPKSIPHQRKETEPIMSNDGIVGIMRYGIAKNFNNSHLNKKIKSSPLLNQQRFPMKFQYYTKGSEFLGGPGRR